MLADELNGSMVALVTPFDDNEQVQYERISELIEFHEEAGTSAIVVCGNHG